MWSKWQTEVTCGVAGKNHTKKLIWICYEEQNPTAKIHAERYERRAVVKARVGCKVAWLADPHGNGVKDRWKREKWRLRTDGMATQYILTVVRKVARAGRDIKWTSIEYNKPLR